MFQKNHLFCLIWATYLQMLFLWVTFLQYKCSVNMHTCCFYVLQQNKVCVSGIKNKRNIMPSGLLLWLLWVSLKLRIVFLTRIKRDYPSLIKISHTSAPTAPVTTVKTLQLYTKPSYFCQGVILFIMLYSWENVLQGPIKPHYFYCSFLWLALALTLIRMRFIHNSIKLKKRKSIVTKPCKILGYKLF